MTSELETLFPVVDDLRLVPIPEAHQPEYVSGSSFDLDLPKWLGGETDRVSGPGCEL